NSETQHVPVCVARARAEPIFGTCHDRSSGLPGDGRGRVRRLRGRRWRCGLGLGLRNGSVSARGRVGLVGAVLVASAARKHEHRTEYCQHAAAISLSHPDDLPLGDGHTQTEVIDGTIKALPRTSEERYVITTLLRLA